MLLSGYCTNLNGDIMKKIIFEIIGLMVIFIFNIVYSYYNITQYDLIKSCILGVVIDIPLYIIITIANRKSKKKKNKNQNKDNEE